jgi:AcrR family transcriptional regulator
MSSSLAATPPNEATRRVLSARQARTVQGLADAALEELREVGYEQLTVRNVARRSGVAAATAYTYFASKEHLVTEVFWRMLNALPEPRIDRRRCPADRVTDALADIMRLAADEPALMSACTIAMMADDPDVRHLRDRIGLQLHHRFAAALGDGAEGAVLRALDLAMAGALVRAGTGHLAYADVPARIAEVATLLLEKRP